MATKTYRCNRFRTAGTFEYSADFAQASSPIRVRFLTFDEESEWQPVPFQVADCWCDRRKAEAMIANYFK